MSAHSPPPSLLLELLPLHTHNGQHQETVIPTTNYLYTYYINRGYYPTLTKRTPDILTTLAVGGWTTYIAGGGIWSETWEYVNAQYQERGGERDETSRKK